MRRRFGFQDGRAGRCVVGTLALTTMLFAVSCGKPPPDLMRAPVMYTASGVNPYDQAEEALKSGTIEVFYATDRNIEDEESLGDRYGPDRGYDLLLGRAQVRIGKPGLEWSDVREQSFLRERDKRMPMEIVELEQYGALHESIWFALPRYDAPESRVPQRQFATAINDRLAGSRSRDVYIFVAAFRNDFNYAAFVAAEFHHFMGRDGVFIAYSWPTRLGELAYFSATECAYQTVRNLRELIRFLAEETDARKIHLMTYSAGARVLAYALRDLRLLRSDLDESAVHEEYRIGQVIFNGPDIDKDVFGAHVQDGMADLTDQITIYTSDRDQALATSRFIFRWERLGSIKADTFRPETIKFLASQQKTNFVVVTNTECALEDNAHGYYRRSPWVSSDIVLTLRFGLAPPQRALIREAGEPVWRFPDDYPERIGALTEKLIKGENPPGIAAPGDSAGAPTP
jgi:esterase/lipase superfamily enzyme